MGCRERQAKLNNGFTVVELLVVLAILTLLAAIVFPAMLQARNRARSTQCISNLKQLATAASLYASDYEGRLPFAHGSPFAGSSGSENSSAHASLALQKYTTSTAVFVCPNDRESPPFGFENKVHQSTGTSYLWNMAKTENGWLVNGKHIDSIGSSVALFSDYGVDWHGNWIRDGLTVLERSQVNQAYADGHAASSTTLSFVTREGKYVAGVAVNRNPATLWIAGTTEYGSAYVHGTVTKRSGLIVAADQFDLEVYGTIYSDRGINEVSQVFSYSRNVGIEIILQRIVAWVEDMLIR